MLGHVFVDEVIGREDFITYAVGIRADGKLLPVRVLEYRESHGGEIRNPRWLAQFAGRSTTQQLRFGTDIKNIAGATLSSEHVTAGVRRILAIRQTRLQPALRPRVEENMPNWLRRCLYSSLGLLWLSGLAWLIMHLFFAREAEFGVAPHPWQPRILVFHGVLAVVATFLFGWIAGSHVG